MKQVKVTKTEQYEDSYGKYFVCRGRLVLIDKVSLYEINGKRDILIKTSVIISEIEDLEIGKVYNEKVNDIVDFNDTPVIYNGNILFKILTFPENLSPEILQDIVDRKLKDGDEVLVECEKSNVYIGTHPLSGEKNVEVWDGEYEIKLDKDNYIKLFPVKKEEDYRDELYEKEYGIKKEESWIDIESKYPYVRESGWGYVFLWLKENYNPPIRK